MTTPQPTKELKRACIYLAQRDDGAITMDGRGFNKSDTSTGQALAWMPEELWGELENRIAWLLLHKYDKQLLQGGIVYAEIAEPPTVEGEENLGGFLYRYITFTNGEFHAHFPYSTSIIEDIKQAIPATYRRFDGGSKVWCINATPDAMPHLEAFIESAHFAISHEARDKIAEVKTQSGVPDLPPCRITREGDHFLAFFPKAKLDLFKSAVPQSARKFNGVNAWTIYADPDGYNAILTLEVTHAFVTDDSAKGLIAEIMVSGGFRYRNRRIYVESGNIFVDFPYDVELIAAFREAIPENDRTYVAAKKATRISKIATALTALEAFAQAHGFIFEGEAPATIDSAITQSENNLDASRAEVSDLVIANLGGTPRPYQLAAAQYAIANRGMINGDEMGLGKTISTLITLEATGSFPAIIVCTASTKINWLREATKWLPLRRAVVLDNKVPDYTADVLIINYDNLKKHAEALKSLSAKAITFDESQKIKNPQAQRTVTAKEISKTVTGLRLCLTGTPIVNRPIEFAAQLEAIDRLDDVFGGWWKFAQRYTDAKQKSIGYGKTAWDFTGASNLEELNARARRTCYIRRLKADVEKDLPPIQWTPISLELSNKREYQKAERDLINFVRNRAKEDRAFNASLTHLPETEREQARQQRASDAAEKAKRAETLVQINILRQLVTEGKMEAITEWVSEFLESDEKLILFAWHQATCLQLAQTFNAPTVMGGDSAKKRQEAVDRFQNDPERKIIVLNLQAGGEGLTLTAASHVAFAELAWTPGMMDQAIARAHRIGQTAASVNGWLLLADGDTVDSNMSELIDKKRAIVAAATDGTPIEGKGKKKIQMSILPDLLKTLVKKGKKKSNEDDVAGVEFDDEELALDFTTDNGS